jgi:hypothetical protein
VLMKECINLCNARMRQDWGNPKHQFVWSVRDKDATNFALICLSDVLRTADIPPPAPVAAGGLKTTSLGSAAELLSGLNVNGMVTLKEALDIPEGMPGAVKRLREHIAPAFGLRDPTRITRVLNSMGYVLSNDFAIKLLIINERRRVGANVILCGDTGVGKSEVRRGVVLSDVCVNDTLSGLLYRYSLHVY